MAVNFAEMTKEEMLYFDTKKYGFVEIISKIFEVSAETLPKLHETIPGSSDPGLVTFENDQATAFHKKFYNSPLLQEFLDLYTRFVKEHIAPMFKGEKRIIYQKKPTFRVHLPNNVAVGKKHRDFDYFHPPGEINFWLPFTKVWGTNGLIVETEPEKGDFHSITMEYGQIFRFYGNMCWHYNEVNDTGATRVSVDFRVIPESKWNYEAKREGASVKSGLKFEIGSYYDIYDIPQQEDEK